LAFKTPRSKERKYRKGKKTAIKKKPPFLDCSWKNIPEALATKNAGKKLSKKAPGQETCEKANVPANHKKRKDKSRTSPTAGSS